MLFALLVALLSVGTVALEGNRMICWDHAPTVETNVILRNIITKGFHRLSPGSVITMSDSDNVKYHYNLQKPEHDERFEQVFEYNFDAEKLFQAKGKFRSYFEYDLFNTIYFVCPQRAVQCGLFCCPNSRTQQGFIESSYLTDFSDIRRIDPRTTVAIGTTTYALIKTDQRCEFKLQSSDKLFREVRLNNGKQITSVYFDCTEDEFCCQLGCRKNRSSVQPVVEYARMSGSSTLKASSSFVFPFSSLHLMVILCSLLFATLVLANLTLIRKVRRKSAEKPEAV
ncbi:hypothetical protein L596_004408 [Steinernema carpocapsae]|uniref:CX domain-containing protein n=1 Tax=Steinernema carpocapsae TaxID=34508 RepID=A0A4U8UZU1_STECR|nr:hypothetical protein L596_004408 [Steinernema carpocapsae]